MTKRQTWKSLALGSLSDAALIVPASQSLDWGWVFFSDERLALVVLLLGVGVAGIVPGKFMDFKAKNLFPTTSSRYFRAIGVSCVHHGHYIRRQLANNSGLTTVAAEIPEFVSHTKNSYALSLTHLLSPMLLLLLLRVVWRNNRTNRVRFFENTRLKLVIHIIYALLYF